MQTNVALTVVVDTGEIINGLADTLTHDEIYDFIVALDDYIGEFELTKKLAEAFTQIVKEHEE